MYVCVCCACTALVWWYQQNKDADGDGSARVRRTTSGAAQSEAKKQREQQWRAREEQLKREQLEREQREREREAKRKQAEEERRAIREAAQKKRVRSVNFAYFVQQQQRRWQTCVHTCTRCKGLLVCDVCCDDVSTGAAVRMRVCVGWCCSFFGCRPIFFFECRFNCGMTSWGYKHTPLPCIWLWRMPVWCTLLAYAAQLRCVKASFGGAWVFFFVSVVWRWQLLLRLTDWKTGKYKLNSIFIDKFGCSQFVACDMCFLFLPPFVHVPPVVVSTPLID